MTLPMLIWIGHQSILLVGILSPTPVESDTDLSVFVSGGYARSSLGWNGRFDTLYAVAPLAYSQTVAQLMASTISLGDSSGVVVQEDSTALIADADASTAFQGLFLGLAAIAVLVSGLGVTNTLLVAVVERRTEIGIRRALGSTRWGIGRLFLTEAILIALAGSAVGLLLGVWATILGALHEHVPLTLPPDVLGIGVGIALVLGALASVYPALRAATLPPSEALRTSV
ncbi:MAG: ABC transporter permease [Candidatus Dormibacteria bacterium]